MQYSTLEFVVNCTCEDRFPWICVCGTTVHAAPRFVVWNNSLISHDMYSSLVLCGLKLGEKSAPPPPTPALLKLAGGNAYARLDSAASVIIARTTENIQNRLISTSRVKCRTEYT